MNRRRTDRYSCHNTHWPPQSRVDDPSARGAERENHEGSGEKGVRKESSWDSSRRSGSRSPRARLPPHLEGNRTARHVARRAETKIQLMTKEIALESRVRTQPKRRTDSRVAWYCLARVEAVCACFERKVEDRIGAPSS